MLTSHWRIGWVYVCAKSVRAPPLSNPWERATDEPGGQTNGSRRFRTSDYVTLRIRLIIRFQNSVTQISSSGGT